VEDGEAPARRGRAALASPSPARAAAATDWITDEELLECRERFLAASSGSVMATSLRLMQQALDGPTKRALRLPV
jgi:hypothetical protein